MPVTFALPTTDTAVQLRKQFLPVSGASKSHMTAPASRMNLFDKWLSMGRLEGMVRFLPSQGLRNDDAPTVNMDVLKVLLLREADLFSTPFPTFPRTGHGSPSKRSLSGQLWRGPGAF